MQIKSITFAVLTTFVAAAFVSCEDDKATYQAPTFSGITITPDTFHEGDSITIVFNYANRGKNWDYFKQSILIDNVAVTNLTKNISTEEISDPPTLHTVAPAAGTHKVKLNGVASVTSSDVSLYQTIQSDEYTFTVSE